MLPNGKQRLFFSCFTISSTSCRTSFTCFSTLSVRLLKLYSCFPTLSIGFIKSLQIIIFSTKKAPHSFSAVQCILAICRMIWYSILVASVSSKALHTTAGGSALHPTEKGVKHMPITLTFHLFGFTFTIRVKKWTATRHGDGSSFAQLFYLKG